MCAVNQRVRTLTTDMVCIKVLEVQDFAPFILDTIFSSKLVPLILPSS